MLPEPMINNVLVLAKLIHEDYNRNRLKERPDEPLEYPTWEDLPADLKYSNIRQAQRIPEKLALIDCYIGSDSDDPVTAFTDEEVELMSIMEHDMWVEERESNGWVYAPVKNVERRESPYIAPWEQIPEYIRDYDREPTRNIINLVESMGLHVCRHPRKDEVIPEFRYHKGMDAPLIISVTGHIDIRPEDVERACEAFSELVSKLDESYPNTTKVVMTSLAEGSDRIIARKALEMGLNIAPVFPFPREDYVGTFKGTGYSDVPESVADFDSILSHELAFTPCVLNRRRVNEVLGFRALAAYLISNAHIVFSLWNGVRSQYRGGTYDTVRMAFEGIDDDLLQYTSPRTSLSDTVGNNGTHHINSLNDALVAWVGVNRLSDDSAADIPLTSCITDGLGLPDLCFIIEPDPRAKPNIKEMVRSYTRKVPQRVIDITDDSKACVVTEIPEGFVQSFHTLDVINREVLALPKEGDADFQHLEYTAPDGGTRQVLPEMVDRFDAVNRLSLSYQKRSTKVVNLMTVLTSLYTTLFSLLILFSGSASLSLAYTLIYAVTTGLLMIHRRTEEHDRFVNYRAVAENMRVEYYWSIVGLCDTSYENVTNPVCGGQAWMRTVMKGYSSYFVNDYSSCFNIPMNGRMEYVRTSWIIDRMDRSGRLIEKESRKSRIYSLSNNALSVIVTAMSVFITLVAVLLLNDFDGVLFVFDDAINSVELEFSFLTLLKVLMIVLMNLSTIVMMKMNQLYYEENGSMVAMEKVFSKSLRRMGESLQTSDSAITRRNLDIIHELGLFVIGVNDNWIRDSAKRDYKKGARLLNIFQRGSRSEYGINHND